MSGLVRGIIAGFGLTPSPPVEKEVIETSYDDPYGSGPREGLIGVTYSGSLDGAAILVLDGIETDGSRMTGTASHHRWDFDFGTQRIVDEVTWLQGGVGDTTSGTWKWQGSNNGADYDDIGDPFAITSDTSQIHTELNGNEIAYRYYRLQKISGSIGGGARIAEIKFKISPIDPYTGSLHGAHAYWEVYVTAVEAMGNSGIAELEMRATIGGADQCSGGTSSASSIFSGSFVAANGFDNDANTLWHNGGGVIPSWLRYQFAAPVEVAEVSMTSRNDSANGDIATFRVRYSDDGTNWFTAWVVNTPTDWGHPETRVFADPNFISA